jgi:hypothetical protein
VNDSHLTVLKYWFDGGKAWVEAKESVKVQDSIAGWTFLRTTQRNGWSQFVVLVFAVGGYDVKSIRAAP